MQKAREYLKENPQALLLLIICVVLGLGSFIAIMIAVASSGGHTTGQPEGVIGVLRASALTAGRFAT
ncbi:MAG TPA: hypothetical protein VG410_01360 [Solirubrobacteraceae bacterium]|jgi:hypothetical protein|nr:hypothetical protein [Solirubrobacteraceae bacterium]